MKIYRNYSLKDKNTFNIDVKADYFAAPKTLQELYDIISDKLLIYNELLIIGDGSNLLFIDNFKGLVLQPEFYGKQVVSENDTEVKIKALAGENWDDFVKWTVDNNYSGLENLSLIPGRVGASAVQNIGAYGVEVADMIYEVETIELSTFKTRIFTATECEFAYRHSIFKQAEYKGKYLVSAVTFTLSKKPEYKLNYGKLSDEIQKIGKLNIQNVRTAVINIRKNKLPQPELTPNAGSFFKNPIIKYDFLSELLQKYPELVYYKIDYNTYKVAAAWLIDKLAWKNKNYTKAAVHTNQALVLINKDNASGTEILKLANEIKQSVFDTFKILLEFEVNVVG